MTTRKKPIKRRMTTRKPIKRRQILRLRRAGLRDALSIARLVGSSRHYVYVVLVNAGYRRRKRRATPPSPRPG